MEDEADAAAEEMELAQWAESAGEASGANTEAPLVEDAGDESSKEEVEVNEHPATGRQRILWRASSGEPVRPGKTTQRQPAQKQLMREMRAMKAVAAKKPVKAAVAKRTATASSSSKRHRTPTPSPSPSDSSLEAEFDLGSFSPARKRKLVEEEGRGDGGLEGGEEGQGLDGRQAPSGYCAYAVAGGEQPPLQAREESLTKDLEEERQLRRNDTAEHKEYAEGINRWVSRLAGVASRTTTKLATMGMPNARYSPEPNVSPNAKLTLFFEGVLGALEQLRSNWATYLANESRRLYWGALTKVLSKVAF
nr:myristoylated alanine-rich C-kinase substrate-like [Aegilops tauschii subsp. strangulata]